MTPDIPKVSVVMPAYNAALYIREAVDSVLNQHFTDFELIIVNDGSKDDTEAIIRSYADRRIVLINQENSGVAAALNTGIAQARGALIARADADDICLPDRLGVQYEFLTAHPDYVLVASDVSYMDEQGNFVFQFYNTHTGYSDTEIRSHFYEYCPFIHSSVMYRTDVVRKLGGYEKRAVAFEDYFLWSRLIREGKVQNLKQSLMDIRLNASSVTVDDRHYPPVFRALKAKAVQNGTLTGEEWQTLADSYRSISRERKEYSYHLLLAKKYLWDNYRPELARENIRRVIAMKPLSLNAYALYLLTFAGRKNIEKLYNKIKNR
ncbi:glycosyltransferase family 2 protein [Rurimicrobium arvi]|uniref:Glycosyltransferase 2-like domain-containing protein n=1 Tax=Rurimicrobium arvi TaxID=2049916 RepID=A0ABP8MEI8_9BACT